MSARSISVELDAIEREATARANVDAGTASPADVAVIRRALTERIADDESAPPHVRVLAEAVIDLLDEVDELKAEIVRLTEGHASGALKGADAMSDVAKAIRSGAAEISSAIADEEGPSLATVIGELGKASARIASAITADASPGNDSTGGSVGSLTEAVMGVTAGLCRVADAIESLAEAVSESKP